MIIKLVLSRLIASLPSLFGVVVATFILTRALPGDPAAYLAGPAASPEAVAQIREELGLNQALFAQFLSYLSDLSEGDFGKSWSTGEPVRDELLRRIPASLELTATALVIAIIVAIPLGVAAATRQGSWIDHVCRGLTTAGVSLPIFFTGIALVYVFYYLLEWAPAPMGRLSLFSLSPEPITGFFTIDAILANEWKLARECLMHLALPAITLAIFALAPIARMTRGSMLSVLSADYIRTARSHLLPWWKTLYIYAFRNALLPVITTLGMVFSFLLGANVLVEKVFAWPGIGSFAIEALVISDYAAVQGFVLIMGILYVLLNLMIDISYGLIDPRIEIS